MGGTDKIRVLIVDDIAETRETIRKLLQFDAGVEVVGAARTGKEAIDLSNELKPDVILMDINMPDMDGIAATEQIRRRLPFAQIIILSVQNDSNYMRRAMLAGARDFLTKPPMIDELTAAIHRAGGLAQEERAKTPVTQAPTSSTGGTQHHSALANAGKIVTVYSAKGGSGTTTVATNLAVALHNEETRVVLVDANLQFGNINVFLNEQTKYTVLDLAPRVDELDADVVAEVLGTHRSTGLSLLAAPQRPEMADKVSGEQFGKVLQYLRQLYSYVVVDTSAYLTDVVIAAMDVSDLIVLITTQDIPAIINTKSFLSLADSIRMDRKRIMFIMNRFDKRISIAPEKVGENLKQEVVATIPLDERTVITSVNRGIPFMQDNRSQPAGRAITTLAEQVREALTKTETTEAERPAKK